MIPNDIALSSKKIADSMILFRRLGKETVQELLQIHVLGCSWI